MSSTKHNRKDPSHDTVKAGVLTLLRSTYQDEAAEREGVIKLPGNHAASQVRVVCSFTETGGKKSVQIEVKKVEHLNVRLQSFRRQNGQEVEKVPGTAVFAVREKMVVRSKSSESDLTTLARRFTMAFLKKLHAVEGAATTTRRKKQLRAVRREEAEALA